MSTIGTGVIDCQVSVRANGKTSAHPKVCVQNVQHKLEDVPDRFIDDHLVEMFPLFDLARLKLVDVTNLAVHTLQFPQIWQSTGLRSGELAGHRAGVMKSGVS